MKLINKNLFSNTLANILILIFMIGDSPEKGLPSMAPSHDLGTHVLVTFPTKFYYNI